MKELLPVRRSPLWLIVTIVTLALFLLCVASIHFFTNASKRPPMVSIPVVSVCKELAPGMRRIGGMIGDRYPLQFDIPAKDVVFHEGTSDAPPLAYGFGVRPKDSQSLLEISYGPQRNNMVVDRARGSSIHVEKRIIVDDKRRPVGEDDWGYLGTGERWRRVRFQGWVTAEYGFVNKKDAELFDQVINSSCLLPGPG
jgi:hypothetical protein